jgi:GT2 family glycosyltransferase
MKKLSIIIVTYYSDAFIKECLNSIYTYNDLPEDMLEVIIVDNSPIKSEVVKYEAEKYQNVKVISNTQNSGFGQGNNIGADAASGEILLFLNPDTKLIEPIFNEVVQCFNNNDNIRAIGCQLIDGNGHNNNTYGYFPEKWNILLSIIDKCIFKPSGYLAKKLIYPWGANIFVRREDFYNAGKFDETFFLFFEEADLCKRLGNKNTHIMKKKIIHYGCHTNLDNKNRFDAWLKSLSRYHIKYGYNLNSTIRNYQFTLMMSFVRQFLFGKNRQDLKNITSNIITLNNMLKHK